MSDIHESDARIFKAFCDENRLAILALLRQGEKNASEILEAVEVGQSTLSHHMQILCQSGIVTARRAGKWTYYSISDEGRREANRRLWLLTAMEPRRGE